GMLADGIATRRGRRGALIHFDRVNRLVRGRRGARLAAITSGGAIPDNADYRVLQDPQDSFVGTINEDFAIESMPGDIFQLGNTSWRILKIEADAVRVEDAHGEPPTIPFWFGEAPSRSHELSGWVSFVRRRVAEQFDQAYPELARSLHQRLVDASTTIELDELADVDCASLAQEWVERYGICASAAEQLVEYLVTAYVGLGAMPTAETLVAERFFDEAGGMQLVVHSPFGSRVNRAWGLALRKSFCRHFNFELQAAATEDAIVLSLNVTHSFQLDDVFRFLSSQSVRRVLTQALLDAPMFTTRWRWNANRALAVLRFRGGRRVPPRFQRMDAEDLVSVVFPDQLACLEHIVGDREIPDHPLVQQTIDDCLEEAMDCRYLEQLLRELEAADKRLVARDLRGPSPLAQEILAARPYAFLDGAPLEERRTQAVLSRRYLDLRGASELGHLDPAAIEALRREIWPSVRDRHELHDALAIGGYLTEGEGERGDAGYPGAERGACEDRTARDGSDARDASGERGSWRPYFDELRAERRAVALRVAEGAPTLWVASERLPLWTAVAPSAQLVETAKRRLGVTAWLGRELPDLVAAPSGSHLSSVLSADAALVEVLRGRFESLGPVSVSTLTAETGLSRDAIETAVLNLEAEGFVFQGRFSPGAAETEWCERRLLARLHRYTVARLRREIQPVSQSDFMRFLLRWQRVHPETRGDGPAALEAVLEQLDGFEIPAVAWEGAVLPTRLQRYDPNWLEHTMLSGRYVWGRLTPPADTDGEHRRGGPVKHSPIALARRGSALLSFCATLWPALSELPLSSTAASILDVLASRGALFFDELQQLTRLLPTPLEEGLGELVFFGLVTADSFNGLRALLVPASKRNGRGRRGPRAPLRFGMAHAGRWGLFRRSGAGEPADDPQSVLVEVAHLLLRRYGVVVRAVLEREGRSLPPWRELLRCFRRLEARGEIRGGRFVDGFSGEQFALPEAIPALRDARREQDEALLVLSAADPLNLTGIVTPGDRVPALVDNRVVYRGGVPVAARVGGEVRRLDRSAASIESALDQLLRQSIAPAELRGYLA
ncbi:MAG: DEAD/DEAH box helicase, partial [Myxococcales bacterium]|nr:DEAD/DEAH box helicase [Myxococcales bacterium]